MRRPPIVGFVAVWALLAPFVLVRAAHDVRVVTVDHACRRVRSTMWCRHGSTASPRRWRRGSRTRPGVPALFVSSSGGGIRAAYWTAAVLDCVTERRPVRGRRVRRHRDPAVAAHRRERLVTMSGISGGSLGLAAYVGATMPMGTERSARRRARAASGTSSACAATSSRPRSRRTSSTTASTPS